MAAAERRGFRPGGVVRALGRLSLLVALGFGAGLLGGIVFEEPELLAAHWRGQSEEVVLATTRAADAGSAEAEARIEDRDGRVRAVAEVRVESGAPRDPLPRVAARPAPQPTARTGSSAMREEEVGSPVTQTPKRDRAPAPAPAIDVERPWAIQVGAFSDENAARRLVAALTDKGYPAQILPTRAERGRWRVRVQPVDGEAEARKMATTLKQIERLPTWVLPMEGS